MSISCRLTALVVLAVLGGCASEPRYPASSDRYTINQDRAPANGILDISSIPEVVPEPLSRTLAGNRSPYTILGRTYLVLETEEGYFERGVASWYGEKFHGHNTSNGEVFDMYQASAAHKTLPIPSFLRVTNLDNNRSIVVRVNDRGPFHGDRVVDLSYAAALKLGYADTGTARVQLEAIMPPSYPGEVVTVNQVSHVARLPGPAESSAMTYLQIGAFADPQSARQLSARLQEITTLPVFIQETTVDASQRLHRVRVGPIADSEQIRFLTERVVAANLGSPYTVTE